MVCAWLELIEIREAAGQVTTLPDTGQHMYTASLADLVLVFVDVFVIVVVALSRMTAPPPTPLHH